MTTRKALTVLLVLGLATLGCESTPPTAPEDSQVPQQNLDSFSTTSAVSVPISGMMSLTGGTPSDVWVNPAGMVHMEGGTAVSQWTGDMAGTVTFYYKRIHSRLAFRIMTIRFYLKRSVDKFLQSFDNDAMFLFVRLVDYIAKITCEVIIDNKTFIPIND